MRFTERFGVAALITALISAGCGSGGLSPRPAATADVYMPPDASTPAVAVNGIAPDPRTIGSYVGRAPATQEIDLYISLPGRNQSALQALIQAQNAPGTASFHQYLTPQQYGREFGADPTQYAQTIAALRAAGFTIDDLPANLKDIVAHGSAAAVAAFFRSPVDLRSAPGETFYALHDQPFLPVMMRGAFIVGLDNYHQVKPHFAKAQSAVPMVTIDGSKGWGAKDIESVYDLTPIYSTNNGSGITIADATFGLARASDFSAFTKKFALSAKLVNVSAGSKSPTDNNGETTLDVEYMAAVAPDVTIDQVTAPANTDAGFNTMYSYIVNKLSTVHLVSTSWGDCEAEYGSSALSTDESLVEQAYSEGQYWLSAAGDDGVDDCGNGTKGVDFPGSSPYVVSVGGTRVTPSSTSGGSYTGWKSEVVWDDTDGCNSVKSCNNEGGGAGGGGASIDFSKPSFQSGVTPADGKRDVPDVSFMADDEDPNGGYFIYFEGSWENGWGGTSFAAPEWTAFLSLVEEHDGSIASPLTRLYALASGSSYDSYFHDVKSGCNTYDGVTGFCAAANYDQGSGWGSPIGDALWGAY
jgi:subtilase family serine protease